MYANVPPAKNKAPIAEISHIFFELDAATGGGDGVDSTFTGVSRVPFVDVTGVVLLRFIIYLFIYN